MKIDKELITNITVTLTAREVDEIIKTHIKEKEGIDIKYINYMVNEHGGLQTVSAIVNMIEKLK